MSRPPRQLVVVLALIALLPSLPGLASAQERQTGYDIQTFSPAVGPYSVFSTEAAQTLPHLRFTAGALINYSSEPLVERFDDDEIVPIISQQLATHIQAGVGLTRWLQLDLSMPLYLVNDGAFEQEAFTGFTRGDLALRAKSALLSSQDGPVGLGLAFETRLPTGDDERFTGGSGATFTPMLIADTMVGPVLIAINAGAALREEQQLRNLTLGNRLVYRAGGEWRALDGLISLGAEVYGTSQFSDLFAPQTSPLEGLLGLKLHTPAGFSIMTGVGRSIIGGLGAPGFRSFVGLSYVKPPPPEAPAGPIDTDGDGLPDDLDLCPMEPEDFDGFEDDDGCPDPDNDGDGVLDVDDTCPDEAGLPERDGCPVRDADGDGVEDADDPCPEVPGPAENMGCPWPDSDGDGVIDPLDKCPDVPGVAELEGCPRTVLSRVTLEQEEIVIKEQVFFENNKATILPESFPLLDEVVTVLREYPSIRKVEIDGHTDSVGKAAANKKLSQERADAVMRYLVEHGIDAGRLIAIGYGRERPLVSPERTKADRAMNRRVEFKILERDAPPAAPADDGVEDGGTVDGVEEGGTVDGVDGDDGIEDGGTVDGVDDDEIEDGGTIDGVE